MTPEEVKQIVNAAKSQSKLKEYISIILVVVGWVVSAAYFTETVGERVGKLESQISLLTTTVANVMQVAVAQEKFSNLQQQIDRQEKHLEYNDQVLDRLKRR